MARPSRTGGKKSEAKARNASPAKGRKTTKTKPRIAPAATRVKRRSVSDPSKDLKEAREQQAATAEILKVIASSPDGRAAGIRGHCGQRQSADRRLLDCGVSVCRRHCSPGSLHADQSGSGRSAEGRVPAPRLPASRHFRTGASWRDRASSRTPKPMPRPAVDGKWRGRAAFAACCCAADEQGNGDRRDQRHPREPRFVFAASRPAAADLRRPGRDRHRECAAVQRGAGEDARPHGVAAAADRHRRRAQGDQPLAVRSSRCSIPCEQRLPSYAKPTSVLFVCEDGDVRLRRRTYGCKPNGRCIAEHSIRAGPTAAVRAPIVAGHSRAHRTICC